MCKMNISQMLFEAYGKQEACDEKLKGNKTSVAQNKNDLKKAVNATKKSNTTPNIHPVGNKFSGAESQLRKTKNRLLSMPAEIKAEGTVVARNKESLANDANPKDIVGKLLASIGNDNVVDGNSNKKIVVQKGISCSNAADGIATKALSGLVNYITHSDDRCGDSAVGTTNIVDLISKVLAKNDNVKDGGEGSGNFGHGGRKGHVGGSSDVKGNKNILVLDKEEKEKVADVLDTLTNTLNDREIPLGDEESLKDEMNNLNLGLEPKNATVSSTDDFTILRVKVDFDDKVVLVNYDDEIRSKTWGSDSGLRELGNVVHISPKGTENTK